MILVLGATGYTGRLVVRELSRRGLPFAVAGRDRARLQALGVDELRVVTVPRGDADTGALRRAMDGVDVVINTVGPFVDLGEPVVRAALEAGCHYVDTTGEQAFVRRVRARFDPQARAQGRVVVPACAYEFAVGSCAAAMALAGFADRARRVDVYYVAGAGSVSRGTARSIARVAGRPLFAWDQGREVRGRLGRREALAVGGYVRQVVEIPGAEATFLPDWADVGTIRTWMAIPPGAARAVGWLAPLSPLLRSRTVQRLADAVIDRIGASEPEDADAHREIAVVARVRGDGMERRCEVQGVDPYGLTARIVVEGARRLVAERPRVTGVVGPERAFEPATLLDDVGLTWSVVRTRAP